VRFSIDIHEVDTSVHAVDRVAAGCHALAGGGIRQRRRPPPEKSVEARIGQFREPRSRTFPPAPLALLGDSGRRTFHLSTNRAKTVYRLDRKFPDSRRSSVRDRAGKPVLRGEFWGFLGRFEVSGYVPLNLARNVRTC
jgi:hypothetical protein